MMFILTMNWIIKVIQKVKIYFKKKLIFLIIVYFDIETLSEAVKILKGEYCLHAINKFKMDRALIFCRTKLDCDNLERYFIKQGGGKKWLEYFNFIRYYINIGPRTNQHRLSCVCLHSDRSADERTNNLQRFKDNQVRFLICTDVAARGIDVSGLPFGKINEIYVYVR